jgi:micrococcal nuclease
MIKKYSYIIVLITVFLLSVPNISFAEKYKVSEITKIQDGDTFDCIIEFVPFDIMVMARIRLDGINCPEVHTKDEREKALGLEAKDFTENFLKQGEVIVDIRAKEKFGRTLAEVFVDGKSLNKALVDANLARSYDGGKRSAWFED